MKDQKHFSYIITTTRRKDYVFTNRQITIYNDVSSIMLTLRLKKKIMSNTEIPKFHEFRKHSTSYILTLLLLPSIGYSSYIGSANGLFVDFFWIGFVFSGLVYLLFLLLVLFKEKPMSKGAYQNPMIVVLIGCVLFSCLEVLLMNFGAGFFGGSLTGCFVTTIVFWLLTKKNLE